MKMKRTWRRRNYFIKKELQGRYIFSFFILVMAGSFLFTLIFSILSADTLTMVYNDHTLKFGKTPVVLLKEILRAHWIFIVAGGVIVALVAMFLTHRFAGPLFRFEQSLQKMIKGNFDFEIRLRSTDEAKETAHMFNDFINTLSSQLREMRDLSDQIDDRLADAHSSVTDAGAGVELNRAIALNKKIRNILGNFKLKNDV